MLAASGFVGRWRRPSRWLVVAWFGATTGCVLVSPTQRGRFARPEMDPAATALEEQFHSHVESAREGAFGGHGTQGGGCGCG
ncbi:MAG: DUF4266 domain-containing protein [Myxococcales bacterium FL481]|nr:MAG: DUF4266 domain-containing protein [Myxococcales bacterium FL481]